MCNVPAASNEAVAEHAFALYMACRRRVVRLHEVVLEGEVWRREGTCKEEFGGLPAGWRDEVVGIVGVGELGECGDGSISNLFFVCCLSLQYGSVCVQGHVIRLLKDENGT